MSPDMVNVGKPPDVTPTLRLAFKLELATRRAVCLKRLYAEHRKSNFFHATVLLSEVKAIAVALEHFARTEGKVLDAVARVGENGVTLRNRGPREFLRHGRWTRRRS